MFTAATACSCCNPALILLVAWPMHLTGTRAGSSDRFFDSGAVIALGQSGLFLFLAVRAFVRDIIKIPFLKCWAVHAAADCGASDMLPAWTLLRQLTRNCGRCWQHFRFSPFISIVRGLIAGSLLFLAGGNLVPIAKLRPLIRKTGNAPVDPASCYPKRDRVHDLLALRFWSDERDGINLGALAVLGAAIGVGLGFGLQEDASKLHLRGVIFWCWKGRPTVGDYVELERRGKTG